MTTVVRVITVTFMTHLKTAVASSLLTTAVLVIQNLKKALIVECHLVSI